MNALRYYLYIGVAFILVVGTWRVCAWKYEASYTVALEKARAQYEQQVLDGNKRASALETKLAAARNNARGVYKEVEKYVASQADDPVCLDDRALRLYNAGRRQ